MPSLLDLPRELRDIIIADVLNTPRMPPAAPSKTNRADFIDFDHKATIETRGHGHMGAIYHEQRGTQGIFYSQVSLLLTNRQISVETKSVMKSRMRSARSSSVDYILDLSVQNEMDLYPTWLQVPVITNRVSTLYVNVRLFGHLLPEEDAARFTNDGRVSGLRCSFYSLLERFLQYGPADKKPYIPEHTYGSVRFPLAGHYESEDHNVTVRNLILNFESAESELPFESGNRYGWSRFRRRHCDSYLGSDPREGPGNRDKYTTRPEWLAKFLAMEINYLLNMTFHTSRYGVLLHERIGTIRFLVDGKLAYEYDLPRRLAELRKSHPSEVFGEVHFHHDRVYLFWEWKKKTLEWREQVGLPVLWPQDPELQWV